MVSPADASADALAQAPGRSGRSRHAVAAAPFLVFAAAVAVLLGPSLVGATVALPHDLHLDQLPWRVDAPDPPRNVELRDTIDTYYPVQHELLGRVRRGEDPTWLGDVGFGQLGIEFVGWGALSPFNAAALVLPFDLAWSWAQALRLYAAMAGAYLLVRALGAGRSGATVAGLSFGLSGFMVAWLGWPQSHVGAVVPWVLWAARCAAGPEPPRWAGPSLALTVAGLWLGGFPAVSVMGLLAGAVVGLHALRSPGRTGAGRPARTLVLAGGIAIGTLLAAFTLLPSLGWLDAVDLAGRDDALGRSVPPAFLWTFLVPGVFGDLVTTPRWVGSAHVETIGYAGVVTALLAPAAWVLRPRRPGVWLFTVLGATSGLFAYGFPPVIDIVGTLPGLGSNPPGRALVLVGLSIAVVGGLGADALLARLAGHGAVDRRVLATVILAVAGVAGTVAVLGVVGDLRDLARARLEGGELAVARAAAGAAVGRSLLACGAAAAIVGATGILAARRRPDLVAVIGGAGLIAVVAVDLITVAVGWNTQVPRADLFPDAPGIAELQAASPTFRTAGADGAGQANVNLEYGIADLRSRGFLTARQREVLRAAGAQFTSATRFDLAVDAAPSWEPWLTDAGVRAVLAPAGDAPPPRGWTVTERGAVRILGNPGARPRVSVTTRAEAVAHGAAFARLAAGVARDHPALVETAGPLPDGGTAELTEVHRRGARTRARVRSDDGAVLIALDAAVPGWRASVDGEAVDVVTVDHLYLGVVVPPGDHAVALTYRAPGASTGRALSALGVAGLLGLGWWGWRRKPDAARRAQPA